MAHSRISDETLRSVLPDSSSMNSLLRLLGMHCGGPSRVRFSKRINELSLDTSHWERVAWNKGKTDPNGSYDPMKVLVARPSGSAKVTATRLRKALLSIGRSHNCADCGVDSYWNGFDLQLEIDHIDRNNLNNDPSNLRFLCPNCHSQYGTKKAVDVVRKN